MPVKAVPPSRTCAPSVPGVQWQSKLARVNEITTIPGKVFRSLSANDLNGGYR